MKKQLRSYGIITVGPVIFALSFDWFFAANAVGMGGITGLAQVLNVLFPALSVGIGTILLNVPLFLAGWKFIGFHLLASSLFSMLVSSVAIDAIAAGKEGAISLHRFVQHATLTVGRNRRQFIELDKENALIPVNYDTTPRQRIGYNEALRRTFSDERVAFTEEQIKKETARCLSCGASIVDPNKCIGCGVCTTKCAFDAIHLHRERPECSKMYACEDKMKAILPYMIKREFKIKRAARKSK